MTAMSENKIEEQDQEKWYNSTFFSWIGAGTGIGLIILSLGGATSYYQAQREFREISQIKHDAAQDFIFKNCRKEDLNKDGIPEEYCNINGRKFFYNIDGFVTEHRPDFLKRK